MVVGKHTIANLVNYKDENMENIEHVRDILVTSAIEANLHVVDSVFHKFEPIGVSGVVVLAESHLTIHTWPEYGFIAVDAFTCGQTMQPEKVCRIIAEKIHAEVEEIKTFNRGFKEVL